MENYLVLSVNYGKHVPGHIIFVRKSHSSKYFVRVLHPNHSLMLNRKAYIW